MQCSCIQIKNGWRKRGRLAQTRTWRKSLETKHCRHKSRTTLRTVSWRLSEAASSKKTFLERRHQQELAPPEACVGCIWRHSWRCEQSSFPFQTMFRWSCLKFHISLKLTTAKYKLMASLTRTCKSPVETLVDDGVDQSLLSAVKE